MARVYVQPALLIPQLYSKVLEKRAPPHRGSILFLTVRQPLLRVCDMCFVSVFFGQENLPADPSGPIQELALSWHGEIMQPGGQLSDYGVESSCLIRVHLPNLVQLSAFEWDKQDSRFYRKASQRAKERSGTIGAQL